MNIQKYQNGQSLIELIVALTIIVVSLLGMFVLVSRALGLNKLAAEQYTATYLAAEGIEIARNFFDKSYLVAQKSNPGSKNFYGWVDPGGPGMGTWFMEQGIYEVEYDDEALLNNNLPGGGSYPEKLTACEGNLSASYVSPTTGMTTKYDFIAAPDAISRFYNKPCRELSYLKFDDATGIYSYSQGTDTKFKRIIIIENLALPPHQYNIYLIKNKEINLDFRVTSVVYVESRTGVYTIHLQDHFLPWRIP